MNNSPKIEDVFPLSDIARGMVYHSVKDTGANIYHDQTYFRMRVQGYDFARFQKAMSLLVITHENLRSYFDLFGHEQPLQIVCEDMPATIEMLDLSDVVEADQQARIQTILGDDRQKPFDFARAAPLWRMYVVELGEEGYCFIWVNHHAIADGWSTASLMTELYLTYEELAKNPAFVPVKPKSSYKDFVVEQIIEKKNQDSRDFWKLELENYKRLEFPVPSKTYLTDCTRVNRVLDSELLAALNKTAKSLNTSLKHICFAAYTYMLNMLSYDGDFVVGLVTNNRPLCDDSEKIIGCFLNTVPVRSRVPNDLTWSQYVKWIDGRLKELARYNRLPLTEIVAIIGEETLNRNPIFDTIFNFVDFHIFDDARVEEQENEDESGDEIVAEGHEITNTYFDFNVNVTFGGFSVSCACHTAFVDPELAVRLISYFEAILNHLVTVPDAMASKQEILLEEEKWKLLNTFNDTTSTYSRERLVHHIFEQNVKSTPEAEAIVTMASRLTYSDVNARANRLARLLRQQGVARGDFVAVLLHRSPEMIISLFAILKVGAAYLPIDPHYPPGRIQYLLDDSRARLSITDGDSEAALDEKNETILLDTCELQELAGDNSATKASSDDLAYLIYTSGSTGEPKGAVVEHGSLLNRLFWMQKHYALGRDDVVLQKTTYTFDVSVWELFWWGMTGAKIFLLPPGGESDPGQIVEAIKEHGVTVMHFVPSMLSAFLEYIEERDLSAELASLKQVYTSGEALSVLHVAQFDRLISSEHGTRLTNLYGPTEATIDVTGFDCLPGWDANRISVPIGKPIDNTRMYIIDKSYQLQAIEAVGELCIAGDNLARGYLGRDELTAEKFIKNPFETTGRLYRTGDLARWLPDGNIEFLGRIDGQVKLRGFRIEVGEIEGQLVRHPDLREAAVLAKGQSQESRYLWAYFVASREVTADELREHLSQSLPTYMIPSVFVQLDELPCTRSGKLDSKKLASMEGPVESDVEYIAPETDVEGGLAEIWKKVLNLDNVSVNVNFFHIGGSSLSLIKVNNEINKTFNVDIPIVLMFKYYTIRSLAEYISQEAETVIMSDEEIDESVALMQETSGLLLEDVE